MKPFTRLLVAGILLFLAVACRRQINVNEPPEIIYGEDVCDRCNMIINEERYAAAYWTTDGEARLFDDIGGMLAHYQDSLEQVATFWVHDYKDSEWLNAEDAYFILNLGIITPMGFDIVACAREADALAMAQAQEDAMVMDFGTILTQLEAGDLHLDPMHQH